MKRTPMKRSSAPMKRTAMKRTGMKQKPPKRNDSGWRAECLALRGPYCRSCGEGNDLQVDHVMERSQGGKSVVENGLVLCGPWSRVTPGGCHARKTEGRMLIEPEWLETDQLLWLREQRWVWWENGVPHGHGCKGFAEMRSRDEH